MLTTGNYKLKKPSGTDEVRIEDLNENADIIDAELAKRASKSKATTEADGLMAAADKKKLDGIADGANKYTHPTYQAVQSGFYKVAVDASGHVNNAAKVTKEDIVKLGIPAENTNTTYTAGKGLAMTGTQMRLKAVGETVTDWNAVTENGWYMAVNGTNAPEEGTVCVLVLAKDDKLVRQIAYKMTGSLAAESKRYERTRFNGTWGAWIHTSVYKAVPADAKFTDTWRGIQNNLTSDSIEQSLAAAQGKVLKKLVDGKAANVHKHTKDQIENFPESLKNPKSLIINMGSEKKTYTGDSEITVNITPEKIGAATKEELQKSLVFGTRQAAGGNTLEMIIPCTVGNYGGSSYYKTPYLIFLSGYLKEQYGRPPFLWTVHGISKVNATSAVTMDATEIISANYVSAKSGLKLDEETYTDSRLNLKITLSAMIDTMVIYYPQNLEGIEINVS